MTDAYEHLAREWHWTATAVVLGALERGHGLREVAEAIVRDERERHDVELDVTDVAEAIERLCHERPSELP